eukprot:SAG22_NODE_1118_length_5518_cov_1.906994_3_plen_79_part_00
MLLGFAKVERPPPAKQLVTTITVDVADVGYWHPLSNQMVVDLRVSYTIVLPLIDPGSYTLSVGTSAASLAARTTLTVT